MASYICLWFVVCLARQSSVVTHFWHSCVWGRLVPLVCRVLRFLTTSSDSVGHALAATVVPCSELSCARSFTRVFDNQCAAGQAQSCIDSTPLTLFGTGTSLLGLAAI